MNFYYVCTYVCSYGMCSGPAPTKLGEVAAQAGWHLFGPLPPPAIYAGRVDVRAQEI